MCDWFTIYRQLIFSCVLLSGCLFTQQLCFVYTRSELRSFELIVSRKWFNKKAMSHQVLDVLMFPQLDSVPWLMWYSTLTACCWVSVIFSRSSYRVHCQVPKIEWEISVSEFDDERQINLFNLRSRQLFPVYQISFFCELWSQWDERARKMS